MVVIQWCGEHGATLLRQVSSEVRQKRPTYSSYLQMQADKDSRVFIEGSRHRARTGENFPRVVNRVSDAHMTDSTFFNECAIFLF